MFHNLGRLTVFVRQPYIGTMEANQDHDRWRRQAVHNWIPEFEAIKVGVAFEKITVIVEIGRFTVVGSNDQAMGSPLNIHV